MENYKYIDSTGVIIPDTGDIKTEVQNEFRAVFGDDLDVSDSTPQGLLIAAETNARANVVRNNAALANQINPNISGGIFLDAIWSLTGGERDKATRSQVMATLIGSPGTNIRARVRARTTAGDTFESVSSAKIDNTGKVNVLFQSLEFGPVPCGTGSLTEIVTSDAILGWDGITNDSPAVIGTLSQSDLSVRNLRRRTLALQAVSMPEAIISRLYTVDGVRSLSFRENISNQTQTIDGIEMKPHSIFVCVYGGTDDDVARTLLNTKSGGCAYNGNTNVSVVEPISGQTYEVTFERPEIINLLIKVYIRKGSLNTTGITTQAQTAIMMYANGEIEGESGFAVGEDISPFEIAGGVNEVYPELFVSKVEIAKESDGVFSTNEIPIALDEVAAITISAITVIIQ
ncbi:hypothetical protein LPW36_01920 [Jinshanibacter sp. LJY008]|uniref:Baseplate protein J-like barrel domain-containing protein n=1 Tax=Limnobaculum eriocheiris TaxID=2897391 RepID=A0A9X1MSP1_9GAMM|nr:hypothetical protein [Limnobaculum eriocheiris]MCD1124801.1 hypothetical protein [Limnobaculum eriocheiris]